MAKNADDSTPKAATTVLLVDDEDQFRHALSKQLSARELKVLDASNGDDAIRLVRDENPEVVVLDVQMPGKDGIQTLRELKKLRPEVQVIMLTGHGRSESMRAAGEHDVFQYLEKPCGIEELIRVIGEARQERVQAMAHHEIPAAQKYTLRQWLVGAQNARPGLIILGALIIAAITLLPAPAGLVELLSLEKTGAPGERIMGYSAYKDMKPGETIAEQYGKKAHLFNTVANEDGSVSKEPLSPEQAALRARVMIATLIVAALFWATGAIPIGFTALLVGTLMYFFGVFPPNLVAKAYATDSVMFIFGVLALSMAIGKTGLDRRIGILLLGTSTSLVKFIFVFGPLLAMASAFLSAHALVAFMAPILMLVYSAAIRSNNLKEDRHLIVMMLLLLTFASNIGGPGSPAAGGRNAVMLGILSDYGISLSFGTWITMGFPYVPVMALVLSAYFFFAFRGKIKVKSVNVAATVFRESRKIGKMTRDEYATAAVLILLIILWSTVSGRFGMGGPVIFCLVLLNVLGIVRWPDLSGLHWDVVALCAAASAMGYGLANTGAALWLAESMIGLLPEALKSGTGLCVSASFITGILTNFMSDGATVAAVGPITVPMATVSGTSPIMVGLATAFASSFAHMFIISTPNNAIVYAMARDPETGEQLLTMRDFLVHGAVVMVLSLVVLWAWTFFIYWPWLNV